MLKAYKGQDIALALTCHRNFLSVVFEIEPIFFLISIQQFISLESYFKKSIRHSENKNVMQLTLSESEVEAAVQ